MKVLDCMTKDVVTVRPDTSVHGIAELMVKKRISGVPVVSEAGALVGIIGQGDLLHRAEVGTERRSKWWLRMLANSNELARDYTKAHGLKAEDVMTRKVISIDANDDLAVAADIMDRQRLKRLPVMRDGKLVGILTRTDLIRVLSEVPAGRPQQTVDDAILAKTINDRMSTQAWLNTSYLNVTVDKGVARIAGLIESQEQRRALRVLVEETPGVKSIEDLSKVGVPNFSAA